MNTTQVQRINILRGLAILLVFCYHAIYSVFGTFEIYDYKPYMVVYNFSQYPLKRILLTLTPLSTGQGTTLFLVLSGFLLHRGYLKSGSAFSWPAFFNKRFWRIYPPYLVALLFFSLAVGSGGAFSFLTHLTLTHNLFPSTIISINPSFWSLALEAQLYLLYPAFLWMRSQWGLKRTLWRLGTVTLVGVPAVILSGKHLLINLPFNTWVVWGLGAYLAEQLHYGRRLFTGRPVYLLLAAVLLLLLKMTPLSPLYGRVIFGLFYICTIDWYLHRPERPDSRVGALAAKTMALVGVYSYSIYLFHHPFMRELILFFSYDDTSKLSLALGVTTTFLLFFGVAWVSYHVLEQPSIRLGRWFYQRYFAKAPRALATAAA
ncbi:acyltransferase [Hymenobacter sp. BT18]|uniref:acyltransferase family protein n=1 Tax=Hymenobacter sp. BT18 TaxID=2835648 RepID=UPI00143E5F80|nr:acyltransferase [Hymenobacter sp. BT18]QIX62467.1 acyltransferase [Hymenobacter sp. BT18]